MRLLAIILLALAVVGCPPSDDDVAAIDNGIKSSPTPTYSPVPTYTPTTNTTSNPTQTTMPGTEYPGTNGANGSYYPNGNYYPYPGGSKSGGVARVIQGILDIVFNSKKERRDRPRTERTNRPKQYPTTQPRRYPSNQPTNYPSRRPSQYPSRQPTVQPSPHYPSRRPSQYPSRQPRRYPSNQPTATPTPTPFPSPSSTPIVKEVGELFVISISNYHNYVSLRAEDKNGRNVYILSRVEGKLSHGDNDGSRRQRVKRFDGLFFTDSMDELYLVARKHHDRVKALFSVVPSSLSWEVLHDDVSVTLEVEGITSKQQQEDTRVSLHLQTLYGSELKLKDKRRKHRSMTINNGNGIASFIIKDKLDFTKGCYRWLVASATRAFFSERFGGRCR